MTAIKKELLVPFSAKQMYDLVNDISKYPEFLPWCTSTDILEQNAEQTTADLGLTYSGFTQHFTTCNKLDPNKKIVLGLVKGPFKHLHGEWLFTDIDSNGSKVELSLEFEFNNPILAMTVGKVFENIASQLVGNFYDRARAVYG